MLDSSVGGLFILALQVLDHRRNPQPAAAAGRKETVAAAAANQFAHGKHADPGTRRAIGMSEGNGTAVGIPLVHIDLMTGLLFELFNHGQILYGESLVALHDIHVGQFQAGSL